MNVGEVQTYLPDVSRDIVVTNELEKINVVIDDFRQFSLSETLPMEATVPLGEYLERVYVKTYCCQDCYFA